jgi:hypothetical protein
MIKIQRQFRINKLKKQIKLLNFDEYTTTEKTFEQFTELIQKKYILSLVRSILKILNEITNYKNKENFNITPQVFLSSFIIHGYKEKVMNKPTGIILTTSNLDNYMFTISKQIIKLFNILLLHKFNYYKLIYFKNQLIIYNTTFDTWKKRDHDRLVHELTTAYYELTSVITEIKKQENLQEDEKDYLKCCEERQEDLIDKIIFINGQEYFNNYKHEQVELDEKLQIHIKEKVHDVYWEIFYNEINSDPPKFDKLFNLVEELRNSFCNFIPNNKKIQEEIHDHIDVDLFKNMILHKAFDDNDLRKFAVYVISLIKRFQPPDMDKSVNEWEDKLLQEFQKGFNYAEFLTSFFRSIFNMIDTIKEYIKKLK